MDFVKRKTVRLKGYDYNSSGYYFITFCTKEKQKLLCDIIGTGVLDGPQTRLTAYGEIARKHLDIMSDFYDDLKVEKYVIMPNHVHLLIHVLKNGNVPAETLTSTNSKVSMFVSTFKRFCNKEYGMNILQSRSNDHIIRGEQDYMKIWEYIDNNPAKWADDCFYIE